MNPITAALWITLIGMGLVFIALLILWGLMALMAKIPDAEKKVPEPEVVEAEDIPTLADTPPVAATSNRQQAAALAVAVALAMRQRSRQIALSTEAAEGNVSAWLSVRRANQMGLRTQMYSRKRGSTR